MIKPRRISAYTPSNMDPALLKRIFVQRERLLARIVDRLSTSLTSGDKHHLLLVGPRGSGKTHLVTLACWELKQNPLLADSMRVARLGEDDTCSSWLHLAFGIARSLADGFPDEFPSDFKSPVRGLPPDDAAQAVLNTVIKNLKHRHLLLITENLDQTFHGLGEVGQKKWRAFLQETRRIATLATTRQLFNGVASRKEPFFGFFDTYHLEPLTVDDAQQLIRNIAVEQQQVELLNFLNSHPARDRIRALHHLAGGNHRIYVLLAQSLTRDDWDDLAAAFETLADEMTPHFQERMRSLPDQQRQLVQSLCGAAGAMTVKELVEETFIAAGNCSKQLGNLKAKGYVRSEKRGKESYYELAEPLMRLCLEVKNQRRRPLTRVARFLKAWFTEDQLQALPEIGDGQSRSAACGPPKKTVEHRSETSSAIREPQVSIEPRPPVVAELRTAWQRGAQGADEYVGTPGDRMAMILQQGPAQWASSAAAVTQLSLQQGMAEQLGRGLTQSIGLLDQGDFSSTQLELWFQAWQAVGQESEALQIPLACMRAAVDVMKSDPRSDRPLFQLPLEIRQLVRPLLRKTLGPE